MEELLLLEELIEDSLELLELDKLDELELELL